MTVSASTLQDVKQVVDAWTLFLKQTDFSKLYDSRRIFHGRGGCFQGLEWCCIDVFSPVLFITLFNEPPQDFITELVNKISSQLASANLEAIAVQRRYLPRSPIEFLVGECPDQVFARRKNLRFQLNFTRQNVGFFLDMEPGRQWLESQISANVASEKNVLNLFSYTCAFSVVAKDAGAGSVVNIDMSRSALNTGRDNHRLNEQDTGPIKFFALDILKSWSRIRKFAPYDIIIIDPPSFQKGSFVAEKDYAKIIRRIPQLASPGAQILACLNSPELGEGFLHKQFLDNEVSCEFMGRLPGSKDFPDVYEDGRLKLLNYKYNPSPEKKGSEDILG